MMNDIFRLFTASLRTGDSPALWHSCRDSARRQDALLLLLLSCFPLALSYDPTCLGAPQQRKEPPKDACSGFGWGRVYFPPSS